MAKRNYVKLNNSAFIIEEYSAYFSDTFKTKYCTDESSIYKINVNYGTFVGQVSGDTYTVEEIGERNSGENGLFRGVRCSDTMSQIYVDLSIPETVKRINNLGCQNMDTGNGGYVNQYATYEAGLPIVEIPATVEEIENNAFGGFEQIRVEDPTKYDNLSIIGANYINAYTYGSDCVFYKDTEHTKIYGFMKSKFNWSSSWIVDKVLTIPNTITEIYSFNGEGGGYYVLNNSSYSNIEKVIIPTSILSIGHTGALTQITVYSDSDIVFSYNGVDYTATGTGNSDSYADLNNVLNTAGITTEGLLNIEQA